MMQIQQIKAVAMYTVVMHMYSESDKTLDKLVVIQLMSSCSRSAVFLVTVSGQGSVDMFPRNCANTRYDGSSSGLLVNIITFQQTHICNDYDTGILTVTME